MSQEALAATAGLHRTYISMLERGVRMPSILVAKQVAEALGMTIGGLLTEVDDEPTPPKRKKSGGIVQPRGVEESRSQLNP